MHKVIITGPSRRTGPGCNDSFPYSVINDGIHQFDGCDRTPLLDACRRLKAMGVNTAAEIALFDRDTHASDWRMRTTIGYGASKVVGEDDRSLGFRRYRPRMDV